MFRFPLHNINSVVPLKTQPFLGGEEGRGGSHCCGVMGLSLHCCIKLDLSLPSYSFGSLVPLNPVHAITGMRKGALVAVFPQVPWGEDGASPVWARSWSSKWMQKEVSDVSWCGAAAPVALLQHQ